MGRAVVWLFAATQNNVAIAIAAGVNNRGMTPFGDGQETVRCASGIDRIDRDLDGAVGAVFEAHRARQARGQFTMHLGFRGTCADSSPAHQICQVLRCDHIQELARSRQTAVIDIQQQLTRQAQAFVNLEAVIHLRIVDQPFPANGGTWFFEIDPHHHFQLTVELLAQGHQATGILFRRFGIVD
ncbi:hypothetical protein D3C75_962880 [compost metagenome]